MPARGIERVGHVDHTWGALLIVNHRTRFDQPVLPLRAIAEKAHAEGALIASQLEVDAVATPAPAPKKAPMRIRKSELPGRDTAR